MLEKKLKLGVIRARFKHLTTGKVSMEVLEQCVASKNRNEFLEFLHSKQQLVSVHSHGQPAIRTPYGIFLRGNRTYNDNLIAVSHDEFTDQQYDDVREAFRSIYSFKLRCL